MVSKLFKKSFFSFLSLLLDSHKRFNARKELINLFIYVWMLDKVVYVMPTINMIKNQFIWQ
jgi:hypothetical protein